MSDLPRDETPAAGERRNFYGRVHGKTLRASQKTYLAEDLGKLTLPGVTVEDNPARAPRDVAENLAIHPGDVRDLFDVLPAASVAKCFLNYPDPWPKARHHRRRFVTPGYLGLLARVMLPGAEFRVATDIPDYVRQTLEEVPVAGFDLIYQAGAGGAWEDWISTRYEQKALREGRAPHYLTFRRQG